MMTHTYPDNSKEVKRLREENAELLEALKWTDSLLATYEEDILLKGARWQIQQAIVKAEGKE